MKFFDKIIKKQIAKSLKTSDEAMNEMIERTMQESKDTQQRIADSKKPLNDKDPKWDPIHGIGLDRYAELSVHLTKNNIIVAEDVNEYVEANGVPRGAWPEILNGWSVRIGQDVDIRIRYGVVYGELFKK